MMERMDLVAKSGLRVVERASGTEAGVRAGGRVLRMRPCSLRRVWAVAETVAPVAAAVSAAAALPQAALAAERAERTAKSARLKAAPASRPKVEVAFYRKYTEALLRRYMRLSMEAGRVPSLMGREMFRGHVSHYRVTNFEDVVLFCMDIEKRLARLNAVEQGLVKRVALQEYTQEEAAGLLGMSLRSVVRQYPEALDRLTRMFLEGGMLGVLKSCQ